jgi:hypothetical protein
MAIKSILKPDGSIAIGIATGVMVYAVYDRALPSMAVMNATPAHDINIEAARKSAALTSAAVLAGVTLLTRDVNVFILGSAVLIALDWHARIANVRSPETGQLVSAPGSGLPGQGYGANATPGSSASLSLVAS